MYLITSPFKELYQNKSKVILLGHWGILPEKKENIDEIINYHWLDREKFKNDFKYLNKLIIKINYQLSDLLNSFHNTSFSKEFWCLVLNPWVSMFVSAIYDRWESSIKALSINKITHVNFLKNSQNSAPEDFNNYIRFYNDHLWNHNVFKDIFEFINSKNINIEYLKKTSSFKTRSYKNEKNFFIMLADKICSIFTKKKRIMLIDHYFSFFNYCKLSLSIGQFPRYYHEFYKKIHLPKENLESRKKLKLNLEENNFEKFISFYLPLNLPKSFLEGFRVMIENANKVSLDSDLIIIGNSNFPTELSKFWCALKKEGKSKIILNEHGGSIPIKYRYYDIHNLIFDKYISWAKPKLKNENRLTPSKLIGFEKMKLKNKDLSIITLEDSQYAYYCKNLQSSIIMEDFNQKRKLMENLRLEKIDFKIKTYKDMGWRLEDKYANLFGEKTITNKNVKSVIKQSKLVICTYPETTFLESMITGVPTVLLFMENIWNFDESHYILVEKLRQNNIIFSCPDEATKHIKNIIHNPKKWWNLKNTVDARNYFLNECGNISKNWLKEWKDYILKNNDKLN